MILMKSIVHVVQNVKLNCLKLYKKQRNKYETNGKKQTTYLNIL